MSAYEVPGKSHPFNIRPVFVANASVAQNGVEFFFKSYFLRRGVNFKVPTLIMHPSLAVTAIYCIQLAILIRFL